MLTDERVLQHCPRCGADFEGMGGLSRLDNSSHICTQCEMDESLEDFFGGITPITEWPVRREWSGGWSEA